MLLGDVDGPAGNSCILMLVLESEYVTGYSRLLGSYSLYQKRNRNGEGLLPVRLKRISDSFQTILGW
jgi:hypothetical protein